jgi:hypothetical protein
MKVLCDSIKQICRGKLTRSSSPWHWSHPYVMRWTLLLSG